MKGSIAGLFASPKGGAPKPQVQRLDITVDGCIGDFQRDKKHHGGTQRAVCLFSEEVITTLQAEGHPIFPGSVGENILLREVDWNNLKVGSQLFFEQLVLEVTSDAPPCKTIRDSFTDGQFTKISAKIEQKLTRWYAKVITEGQVYVGENVNFN
ncbi:MAG TPA: MOSC domain-containing protein [Candidatus Poseidoniales archaeon]|nr:MOSC domain-containing protein [Candidatus Poseidoniales archaeon]